MKRAEPSRRELLNSAAPAALGLSAVTLAGLRLDGAGHAERGASSRPETATAGPSRAEGPTRAQSARREGP